MINQSRIEGSSVNLDPVSLEDAEFILRLRQDPEISRFLPGFNITLEQQKSWIEAHQKMEGDYYFLIRNKSGERVGTVSIYDIRNAFGEIGRLASFGNQIENSEAFLLTCDFAFNALGLEKIVSRVMFENVQVKHFNERFGFVFSEEEQDDRGFHFTVGYVDKDGFTKQSKKIREMIDRISLRTE